MKRAVKQVLFWAPRVLCILFAGFISLFALDVFSEGYGFWETILALLIHLIPTAILIVVLAVTWRWEWVGALLFPALGVYYIIEAGGQRHWSIYAFICGPLFLLGVLFLVDWLYRNKLSARPISS